MFSELLEGEIMLELGAKIKALRKSHKYTQQQMGDLVGVTRQHIIDVEAGRGTSLLIFIKLLKEFRKTDKLLENLEAITISPKEIFLKSKK